MSQTQQRNP
ncbi:hypothetical protein CPC698_0087A, partial [Chlamydia psittaci C6/98]